MAQNTGTYGLDDLLAARFASSAEYGLDTINEVLQNNLNHFNAQVVGQLVWLADPLFVQSRIYGTSASVEMVEVDEWGAAPSRKNSVGVTAQFPLQLFKSTLGWTSKYLEIATPREIAAKFLEVRRGYANRIIQQIRASMFNDTNYNFVDRLTNGVTLAVKRFLNADSAVIPESPAGATFDGATHDHYLATATGTLANVDVDAMLATVTEHGNTKGVKIVIDLTNKTAFKALTGFVALGDSGIIYNATDTTLTKMNFDDLENQLIGYWRDSSVEVWIKPWAVANYALCVATEGIEKALGYRQRAQASLQGLRIAANINDYPLIADFMEAEFGFAVWNRTAGSVMITNSAVYSNPSL